MISNGIPVLFDASFRRYFLQQEKKYSRVYVQNVEKFIAGDFAALIKTIKKAGLNNLPVETD